MNKKSVIFFVKLSRQLEVICEYILLRYYELSVHLKCVRKIWFLYLFYTLVSLPFVIPIKVIFNMCGGEFINVLYHVRERSINKEFVMEVDNMIDNYY